MKHKIFKPILHPFILIVVANLNVNKKDFFYYFPKYLMKDSNVPPCGMIKYFWLNLIQGILIAISGLILRPRSGKVGNLSIKEVEKVYDREARTYDRKHHLTTRGMDTVWRRWAAWGVASLAKKNLGFCRVLDLCTGTGLTLDELEKVADFFDLEIDAIGLDYNKKMLEMASSRRQDKESKLIQGDAMKLAENDFFVNKNLLDAVTQVFGIGGISDPLAVFNGVLRILKPHGRYFLVDMHQPVVGCECEVPILGKWFSMFNFEALAYNHYTLPVVLNRLWGWRDTTLDFYQLPLITYCDANGVWWGFETVILEMESQRWWLGLPLMPIARTIVEKVEISEAEAMKRQRILEIVSFSLACH